MALPAKNEKVVSLDLRTVGTIVGQTAHYPSGDNLAEMQ